MTEQAEIYPMAMFPTLSVADVAASMEWYTAKIGFQTVFSLPGHGGGISMAHLRWRKHADLLLAPGTGASDDGRPKGMGVALSFLADATPVDVLAAELAARGVEIVEGPVTRPWNVRDIVVHDPDGFRLVFFTPVDTSRSFEDVMEGLESPHSASRRR